MKSTLIPFPFLHYKAAQLSCKVIPLVHVVFFFCFFYQKLQMNKIGMIIIQHSLSTTVFTKRLMVVLDKGENTQQFNCHDHEKVHFMWQIL